MAERITKDNADVLKTEGVVLADFYSDSCVPCKRMSPVLAELEDDFGDKIKAVKINVNYDGELAEEYDVHSVPTFIFLKDGKEVRRTVGVAKKAELAAIIDEIK